MTTLTKSQQLSMVLVGTVLAALGTAQTAEALSLVTNRTTLGANESVDWSVLGSANTSVSNPFTVSASAGTQVTGSKPSGLFERLDQGNGWNGNFSPGDALLWNNFEGVPMQFTFSNAVRGVGTQIQNVFFGAFTASIEAFDGSGNSLGSFNLDGLSDYSANNSAIFIGVLSDQNNIAKVTFNVANTGGFAINQLSINSTPIPTPALLPGLIGMGIAAIRRQKGEASGSTSEA